MNISRLMTPAGTHSEPTSQVPSRSPCPAQQYFPNDDRRRSNSDHYYVPSSDTSNSAHTSAFQQTSRNFNGASIHSGPTIARNRGNININFNANHQLTTVSDSRSQAPYHNHSGYNSPHSAAPVPFSAGQKRTRSSYNDEYSDDESDKSLTSQLPQSGATPSRRFPATAVPPAGSIQVGPEVIAAITQMYSLNSCWRYAAAAKMTSLMSFAALNMCLQLVEETATKVSTFSSELAVLRGLVKTSWVVDDTLKAQFADMAKRALIKEDRTNFVNMYQEILQDVERRSDELKITEQIKAKAHKAAILRAIRNACNNVRNNARKFILVSVQDGPLCLTLEDFAVSWLTRFNPAAVTIPLSVTLLAQVVQIRDFAMHNLELLDLDGNDDDENDEGMTPAPTTRRGGKKAKVDMPEPKFWKRFETHLRSQRDSFAQDKDGYQCYIGGLITKDHARFGKPKTTALQGDNIPGSSTNPCAPGLMTADHDLNNMLVTMFDHSVRR
ncbi:hypothetical protein BDR07DRAFT_1486552 [Suillus spraguei]|nr:hypothetical protein BDR07DRAFT_1486552 [Suillus spraguei]